MPTTRSMSAMNGTQRGRAEACDSVAMIAEIELGRRLGAGARGTERETGGELCRRKGLNWRRDVMDFSLIDRTAWMGRGGSVARERAGEPRGRMVPGGTASTSPKSMSDSAP